METIKLETLHYGKNQNLKVKSGTFTLRKKGTVRYKKHTYPDLYAAMSDFLQWTTGFLVDDINPDKLDYDMVLTDGTDTKTLQEWITKDCAEISKCHSFGTISLTSVDCDEPEYFFSNQIYELDNVGVVLQWPTLSRAL